MYMMIHAHGTRKGQTLRHHSSFRTALRRFQFFGENGVLTALTACSRAQLFDIFQVVGNYCFGGEWIVVLVLALICDDIGITMTIYTISVVVSFSMHIIKKKVQTYVIIHTHIIHAWLSTPLLCISSFACFFDCKFWDFEHRNPMAIRLGSWKQVVVAAGWLRILREINIM